MLGLFISLAVLGLLAIDPIGIGAMPVLLLQKNPYRRAAIFLGGSYFALMVMGLLCAKGFGQIALQFEYRNNWLIPSVELVGGGVLLIVAFVLFVQIRCGKLVVGPSDNTRKWLTSGSWQLFLLGALLVAAQSIVDVVFLAAMVRVGQSKLSMPVMAAAVSTYAISALALQLVVVVAFWIAPARQKNRALESVREAVVRFSYPTLLIISVILSALLFILAFQTINR